MARMIMRVIKETKKKCKDSIRGMNMSLVANITRMTTNLPVVDSVYCVKVVRGYENSIIREIKSSLQSNEENS